MWSFTPMNQIVTIFKWRSLLTTGSLKFFAVNTINKFWAHLLIIKYSIMYWAVLSFKSAVWIITGQAQFQEEQQWLPTGGRGMLWRRNLGNMVWQGFKTCRQSYDQGINTHNGTSVNLNIIYLTSKGYPNLQIRH